MKGESGQSQLLAASVIGTVILTGALFSLDLARRNRDQDLYAARRVEMRSALEQAIKTVSHIYHDEAGCDPVSLDDKLSVLQPDGTLSPIGALGRRQLSIAVGGHAYSVGIGDTIRLDWAGTNGPDPTITGVAPALAFNRGTSQDAITEVWTTYNSGSTAPTSAGIQHQRTTLRAALVNNCTNPCSSAGTSECPVSADRSIAYHRLNARFLGSGGAASPPPGSAWPKTCFDPLNGTRYLGDLNAPAGYSAPDGLITTTDLFLLKNYVRSGDPSGATPSPSPFPGPAFLQYNGVTHVSQTGLGLRPCADFNGDSLVNESDLHLLEKAMRGYLFWLPTHPLPPAP